MLIKINETATNHTPLSKFLAMTGYIESNCEAFFPVSNKIVLPIYQFMNMELKSKERLECSHSKEQALSTSHEHFYLKA